MSNLKVPAAEKAFSSGSFPGRDLNFGSLASNAKKRSSNCGKHVRQNSVGSQRRPRQETKQVTKETNPNL